MRRRSLTWYGDSDFVQPRALFGWLAELQYPDDGHRPRRQLAEQEHRRVFEGLVRSGELVLHDENSVQPIPTSAYAAGLYPSSMNWLAKEDWFKFCARVGVDIARGSEVAAAHHDAATGNLLREGAAPRIAWKRRLAECLDALDAELGKPADVNAVISALRAGGDPFVVSDSFDKLVWRDEDRTRRVLTKKTVKNAISELRAARRLASRGIPGSSLDCPD